MLPAAPVLLLTDALLFALVAVGGAFFWVVARRPLLLAAWKRVLSDRLAAASLVVLAAYLAVGLLDSMHYRKLVDAERGIYSVEVESVLDWLTVPLRERVEKTYSAPFASRLFVREPVQVGPDRVERIYPPLAGKEAGNESVGAVGARVAGGVVLALAAVSSCFAGLAWLLARRQRLGFRQALRRIWREETDIPYRTMLLTLGAMLALILPMLLLSSQYHVLGTDKVGQDVFYLSLKSIRTGLVIGLVTTLVMLPLAVILGVLAGYFGGWVDDAIQYVYTTLNAIPGVLLIAAAVLMMQVFMELHADFFDSVAQRADFRLFFLCAILGMTSWTGLCRLVRAETLKLRELDYVQAAHAFGVGQGQIIARHIVPNLMHIVIISVVMDFSALVLAEAVLSYVGVGVDPMTESWGNMINAARLELARDPAVWWILASAFVFMFLLVLAANLLADAVRTAFDPRQA